MQNLKLKRLNKPQFLRRIGRGVLERFLESFQDDLAANGRALPPPGLGEAEYLDAVTRLFQRPEMLPDRLTEALVAIDDLSGTKAFQAVELAPDWALVSRCLAPDSTREEILVQLWLRAEPFLTRAHNGLRFQRLTAFEHAARKMEEGAALPAVRPFDPADKLLILNLTLSLDAWFSRNQRGSETTRVEVYPLRGEYWFLIRHGDLYTRASKVKEQTTEILHFRPERDDVVVYSPFLDELRVNARTKGERDLYITEFGAHLRGSANYFSNRWTYTLEPLRTHGADALDARQLKEIENIRLRELEISYDDGNREVITRAAQGLFEFAASAPNGPEVIPNDGRLARAIFEIQFTGSARAYPVEIRPPNMLKISRRCDPQLIQAWLLQSQFYRGTPAAAAAASLELVAVS